MDEQYLQDLYEWIKKNDSSYEGRYSYDAFKQKMQDDEYATKMHSWISGIDNTFEQRRPLDNFLKLVKGGQQQPAVQPTQQQPTVKKKDDMESDWLFGDGSSELEPSKTERPTTVAEASQTWKKAEAPKPMFMPDYTKPIEEEKFTLTRPTELGFVGRATPEQLKEQVPEFLKTSINAVTNDLLNKGADSAKKELDYYFKDAGFDFMPVKRQGFEDIIVRSPNGQELMVSLGAYNIGNATKEIKQFIEENSTYIPNLKKVEKQYLEDNKKILNIKQVDDEMKSLNEKAESLRKDMNLYLEDSAKLKQLEDKLISYPEKLKNTQEYKTLVEEYSAMAEDNKATYDFLEQSRQAIVSYENTLKKAAGDYTKMKESQGTFLGAMWNKTQTGLGKIASGLYNLSIDYLYLQKELFLPVVGDNYVDYMAKAMKYGEVEGKDVFGFNPTESMRNFFVDNFGTATTSKEYTEKIEREGNIFQRGLLGLAESSPAMIGNSYMRLLNMYALTTDYISKEMEDDPDFKNMSEMEKLMIKAPIGVVGAALEEMGFRNLIRGTSIIKNLTGRVISRLPAGATAAQVRYAAINEIKDLGIKGTLALTGSALAEAETGLLQQVNEYAVKDIYNAMKGKDMFDTPDFLSKKYFLDLADASATEAVGGLVLGVPNAISTAFQKDGFQALDDATFKIFEDLAKDNDSRKFFVTSLKNKINLGEVTPNQGKQMLDAYDQALGMIGMVPDEITDPESRKIAMDLLSERKRLETKKQGKDDALAKPIQNKIDQINEQLTKLTEDAIQKQAAGQVSVQPEAGAGQEVEVGGPEAKPKITPEESKRKEDLVAAFEDPKETEVLEDGKPFVYIKVGEYYTNKEMAQAELDAIIAKEQAVPAEQGGAEQAPAKLTPEERKAKEDDIEQRRQNELEQYKDNLNDAWTVGSKETIEERINAKYDAELAALQPTPAEGLDAEEKARKQYLEQGLKEMEQSGTDGYDGPEGYLDKIVAQEELDYLNKVEQLRLKEAAAKNKEKSVPVEGLGAQLETVAKEEQTPVEVTPAEVVERTPEQEADLLEELLTGKKKEPVAVEPMVTETVVEEEAKAEIPKAEEVVETDIEIKDTQTTPEEVQQQIEAFDEEALPEEEKPKPGTVAELAIEDINADPERFQYKEVTDKEAGVTEQFKGKMPFRKELAGVISVWVDPADGKTYVINGHHRLEFARRSGEKTMNVIYIDAKNASEARLKGAMQNIAEGMGTDMDAAKVFRETGMTVEQVQQSGINVKGAKAMNGLSLASLSDNLFNLVTQGKLSQTVGIIIGSTIKSKDVQEQFYNVIKGKNLNNGTIKVMAEDIQAAPTENVEQMDLFGVSATEQASYQQRASFIAGIRAIVSKAKNILGKAAKSKEFLEEYGNEIDKNASETGSRDSAMALAVFDRLRNTSPEIRALIDKGVERIKNGENKNKVLNETAKQIIEATPGILEGVTGQPVAGRGEVKEPGTKGKQGDKGKKLADAVRKNLKIKGPGGLQSNILGIPIAIWNAGVETMAKAIEAGVAINEAVQKAIEHIRENHGKKFNEAAAEKKLLIGHYKGAIEIAREAKVTNEGLKTYLKRQGLTDAQIEPLLKIKERAEKKPISKEKAIGKPAPKRVTVNEMAALKDQIRLEARAAREAKGDLNAKRKMLAAAINDLAKKGSITARQAKSIINRISSVNLDNPVMVERLLDYAENIFNDADYDTRIQEVRKLQDKVKKVNHVSMKDTVREFASINPERIPADRLLDYIQALDDMSTRTPFYQKMNDMFDEVMSYKSESKEFDAIKTFQALIDKLESIAINQVKSVEDYVALIRDINSFKRKAYQLLQNGDITQEQYDQAIENVGKDQAAVEKKYEKELAALKEKLVQEINGLKPEVHPDFTPEEAALINKYLELSDADLASLSPEDLYILNDLLNNIKEDVQLDYYRLSEIVSKAYTNAGGKKLAEQLNESKFNKSTDEGKKLLLEQESAFWEGLLGLGRAASGALQKFIVSPFNRAIASYENTMKDGYFEFSKLKKKYKMKDYNMHRLGMFATYLQEYMAQFDSANKNVKDIGTRDWFGEIISNNEMRNGYKSAKPSAKRLMGLGDTELKTIEKIYNSLPKDANGKVDPKAVYDSFMANDGKFFTKKEKAFFDKIMDWKQKNLTTKQKAANEMNGMPFKEIPFHMMRVRLDQGTKQISPKAEGGSGVVRIEAGTGKERASQRVGPIMTNFEQLFSENLEQTARNYYLQEAINDINNTLSVAKKELKGKKVGLFNTIPSIISDALNFEFDKTESQFLAKNLLAARAAETLFNVIRTSVELTSTFLSYPFRAKTPQGYKELFGKQGQMKKLLDFTSSPLRLRENINKAIDISDGRIKPKGKFEKAINYLSGLPERTMMVTSWMPTFNNEFKDITGVRFDMDKFNSDAAYRQKYGKAIKEAAAVADAQTEKIIGSTTKAGGRREIRIAPKILANIFGAEGTIKKNTTAGQILGFFSNYPYREVTEFLNGFREAAEVYKQGGGVIKSISQLQKPLGVTINLATYGFLSSVVYAMKLMLLGDDEDEEKGEGMLKELMTFKGFMEELQGNAISLGASKYAAGGKAMLQLGATVAYNSTSDEEWKAKIKKLLKNSVFVEPIDAAKVQAYGGKNEVLGAIASYVPQFVLFAKRFEESVQTAGELKVIYDKFQDGGLSALSEDDGTKILAIDAILKSVQFGANLTGTSLPMYNDIKMYMKGVKKEAGVGDIKLSGTENKHKKALQGYKNEKEFKENDPEGYLEAIDEGGSIYKYKEEQRKKQEEKNKDKPFRGMSEEAFKKKFPEEWLENYGPGTDYYEEQRTDEAIERRAIQRKLKKEEKRIKEKNKENEEDTEE